MSDRALRSGKRRQSPVEYGKSKKSKQTVRKKAGGGKLIRGPDAPRFARKQVSRENQEDDDVDDAPAPPLSPPPNIYPDKYAVVRRPRLVSKPVEELVVPILKDSWAINRRNRMGLIFDVVNPARQFKRGAVYNDDDPPEVMFAKYTPNRWEDKDVTEYDPKAVRKPYEPSYYV